MLGERIYEYATKSWPIALGCSPTMPCAPRCWAIKTVNRLAHSPNAKVREAHEGLVTDIRNVAGTNVRLDLHWTGAVRLNEGRGPARVA